MAAKDGDPYLDTMAATLIVCPHCTGVNRIPDGKSAREANCGVCHEPLFSALTAFLLNASMMVDFKKGSVACVEAAQPVTIAVMPAILMRP